MLISDCLWSLWFELVELSESADLVGSSGNVWCIVPPGFPRTRTVDVISDVTWTVCYPWACTSSRSRIGTPGIARSSSTPKSWLRDGRSLPPEELCWDIFWPTRDRIPGYLERSRNEDCAGRAETGRKERERNEEERVCNREKEATSNFGTTGRDLKRPREVKLYLWSKNCCV